VVRTGDCVARRAGWVRMREVFRERVVATRVVATRVVRPLET
jgi:hypothetical protein